MSKYIKGFLPEGDILEFSKLSTWQTDIMKTILIPSLPFVPYSAILQGLNAKAAQVLAVNRVSIIMRDNTVIPANYYGITFMPSGSGKNKLINVIEQHVLKKAKKFFINMIDQRYKKQKEDLEYEAQQKFGDKNQTQKEKYIDEKMPRYLPWQSSDGTQEGLIDDRIAYDTANFGGTFFINSEFMDFIKNTTTSRNQLLTLLAEIYDMGNNDSKTIRGIKYTKNVDNVPSNMLVFSTTAGMHDTGIYKAVIQILNKQLGRRSFVCYPRDHEYKTYNFDEDEFIDMQKKVSDEIIQKSYQWNDYFENVIKDTKDNNYVKMSENAENVYFAYQLYLKKISMTLSIQEQDGLIAEISNRYWKALKLSGIIEKIKNPTSNILTEKSMQEAIYQTEFFGGYLKKFHDDKPMDSFDKFYFYLKKNMHSWKGKTEIRKENFVPFRYFKQWYDDAIEYVSEQSKREGLLMQFDKTKIKMTHAKKIIQGDNQKNGL